MDGWMVAADARRDHPAEVRMQSPCRVGEGDLGRRRGSAAEVKGKKKRVRNKMLRGNFLSEKMRGMRACIDSAAAASSSSSSPILSLRWCKCRGTGKKATKSLLILLLRETKLPLQLQMTSPPLKCKLIPPQKSCGVTGKERGGNGSLTCS